MPTFDYKFTVNAPLSAVANFHSDTRVLKRLTPPPLYMQIHQFDPLQEGAQAHFTMWVGPIPLKWHAHHHDFDPLHGFTDTQVDGPMAKWVHTHRFDAINHNQTVVHEHIEFEHPRGPRGLFTRLLFNPPGLYLLFTYRQLVTRWYTRHAQPKIA
ncbi:MAG TPA: cyclase [Anaerolineae bacterium]|nr:cyclase [Anaerolineae bacterium]